MRIYLRLTKNKELIPFNYQPYLTGALHKWIGKENNVHDNLSMHSFSWLQNVKAKGKQGLNLTQDSYFFISAYDEALIKDIIKGIMVDPAVCFGSFVSDVQIKEDPQFYTTQTFQVASPVFIKRRLDDNEKHITYDNPKASEFLTETLRKKLNTNGVSSEGVTVTFDSSYLNPRTKIIRYRDISNRVSVCPIVVEGLPEQIAFAWNVGVGNSTGIGFGALK